MSLFCGAVLCIFSSFAIILLVECNLVVLLLLYSCMAAIVICLFLAMPRVGLQCVVVAYPGHTHFLSLSVLE